PARTSTVEATAAPPMPPPAPAPIAPEPLDEAPAFEPSIELTLDDAPAVDHEDDDTTSFDVSDNDLDFGDLSDEMKALLSAEPVEDPPAPAREPAPPPVIDWDAPPPA